MLRMLSRLGSEIGYLAQTAFTHPKTVLKASAAAVSVGLCNYCPSLLPIAISAAALGTAYKMNREMIHQFFQTSIHGVKSVLTGLPNSRRTERQPSFVRVLSDWIDECPVGSEQYRSRAEAKDRMIKSLRNDHAVLQFDDLYLTSLPQNLMHNLPNIQRINFDATRLSSVEFQNLASQNGGENFRFYYDAGHRPFEELWQLGQQQHADKLMLMCDSSDLTNEQMKTLAQDFKGKIMFSEISSNENPAYLEQDGHLIRHPVIVENAMQRFRGFLQRLPSRFSGAELVDVRVVSSSE